ncbi:MAG: hypothetical protein NC300_09460 [Bacteroidales bacterium]|nr:hypothetical protein [Clostridium sp.]MCM1204358.1 hypothetical protein [Bacteroidales bacterium]
MYIKIEGASLQDFEGKEVVLFGASSTGIKALEEFERIQAKVLGFCDNNPSKRGTVLEGYPVCSPEDLQAMAEENPGIGVMITSTYEKEISKQLQEMKLRNVYVVRMGVLHEKIPMEDFENPVLDKDAANELLYQKVMSEDAFFIGRVGSTELETLCNYCYFTNRIHGGKTPYTRNITNMLADWCGFFPAEHEKMDAFCELYIDKIKEADLLWSMWRSHFENRFYQDYCGRTPLTLYEETGFPIDIERPWTYALRGKRVLVIHPFEKSIQKNYKSRKKFFDNSDFLPDFELITLKAVQTLADNKGTGFSTWFDALDSMERQMREIDFDIALIGAGAYGFPLAAYAKEMGKKALHIGGMLQLYFGIRGAYYDQFGYHNEYWTRPLEEEKPKGYKKVEAGRYW